MGTNKVKYRKIKWAAGIIFIVIAGLIAGCGICVGVGAERNREDVVNGRVRQRSSGKTSYCF